MTPATPIKMEVFNSGKSFRLLEPITFTTKWGCEIVVPADYITDCASVPRALWGIFPPLGRYQKAAIIHDWLYDTHHANIHDLTRAQCDEIFLEVMRATDVGWRTRYTMYYAVRVAGGGIWDRELSAIENMTIVKLYANGGSVCGAKIMDIAYDH